LGLTVRAGPGTSFGSLNTKVWGGQRFVAVETPVEGPGSSKPWYKISMPQQVGALEGWVAGDYIIDHATYELTRVVNGQVEAFDVQKHAWGFSNYACKDQDPSSPNECPDEWVMWPKSWFEQFDYSALEYPRRWFFYDQSRF